MTRRTPGARRLAPLALAAILALGATPALPADVVYSLAVDNLWDTSANWDGGVLPGLDDNALLSDYNLYLMGSASIRSFSGTGTLSIVGSLNIAADSSIGRLNVLGGTLTGTGTVAANMKSQWSGGTIGSVGNKLVTVFNGGLDFNGASDHQLIGGDMRLAGSSSWAGTNIVLKHSTLSNAGSFEDMHAGNASLISLDPADTFYNAGTYTKSGAGTSTIGAAFVNTGTLLVNAGTLSFAGGVSGAGGVNVAGGTLSFAQASSIGSLNLDGTLTGAGALSVSGASTWMRGTMSGTGSTTFSGGLTFDINSAKTLDQRKLILAGASNWFAGEIVLSGGATLTNNGSFNDQASGLVHLSSSGSGNSFVNNGSYTKNGGSASTIDAAFVNNGTLRVIGSTLNLNGGGSGSGSVNVEGGTLSLAAAAGIGSLNLSGGSLTGAGALTASNVSTWTGGTMNGTGSTIYGGGLAISGAAKTVDQRDLILAGNSSWIGGGSIALSTGVLLTNNGSFADQNAGAVSLTTDGNAGNRFINAGTYTKSGAGTTTIATAFTNSGTLQVNAGTLKLNGSVDSSGSVNVAGGALSFGAASSISNLNLSAGSLTDAIALTVINAATWTGGAMSGTGSATFNSGLAISGAAKSLDRRKVFLAGDSSWAGNGSIALSGGAMLTNNDDKNFDDKNVGTVSLTTDGNSGNTFINKGTYTKSGTGTTTIATAFTNDGTLAVNAGTLNLGNGVYRGYGSVNLAGGTLAAAGDLEVSNGSVWTGGTMSGAGSSTFSWALSILGSGTKTLDQRSLILTPSTHQPGGGSSNWEGNGTIVLSNGAALTNGAGASFGDRNSGTVKLSSSGEGNRFDNIGTYYKFGKGTTTIDVAMTNSGTLVVGAGTLNLNTGVTGSDTGSGTVNVSGGTLNLALASSTGILNLSAGTLTGAGALTVSSAATWTGGAMSGTGSTTFSGGLAISGSATRTVDQRELIVDGSSSWIGNGSLSLSNGAVLTNKGSFTDQNTGSTSISNFVNDGTYTKSGAGSTFFNTFANNGTLAVNAGTVRLFNFSGSGSINIASAGTVSFSGTHVLSTALLGSSTGTVSIESGLLDLSGSFAGRLVINSGTTFQPSSDFTTDRFDMDPGTLTGASKLTVNGAATWKDGGTMSGTGSSTFNGGLAISGATLVKDLDRRSLNLAGASSWIGDGVIAFSNGAVLTNNGSFADQNTGTVSLTTDGNSGNKFINVGTYAKSGTGTTSINAAFTNNGTLQVNAGTLKLNGSVASSGSVNVAGGALSFGAVSSVSNLNLSAGSLTDTVALTVSNAATWTGGGMSGTGSTTFNAGLAINGSATKTLDQRSVILVEDSSWSGNGAIAFSNGAVLTNNAGKTFDDQNSGIANLTSSGAGNSFVNAGTYKKGGAGTTTVSAAFTNNGRVMVNAGTLNLNGALTNNGTLTVNAGTLGLGGGISGTVGFDLASGATLSFDGGTYAMNSTALGGSTGTVRVGGGTLDLSGNHAGTLAVEGGSFQSDGSLTTAKLSMTSGSLTGAGALTVSNASTWTGGIMRGTGSTTFNGSLAIGGSSVGIDRRSLTLAGASTWNGSGVARLGINGAVLTNNGSFADLGMSTAEMYISTASSSFVNNGTYTKSGAGTTTIGTAFTDNGTLEVKAGTLDLAGGLTNLVGTALSGGSYIASGTGVLKLAGTGITNNAADITLNGSAAKVLIRSSGANALANFSTNAAAGRLTLLNGATFVVPASGFTNLGRVTVGAASSINSGVFSNQAGASLEMAGGASSSTLVNAGVLSGYGSVANLSNNTGTVRAHGGTLTLVRISGTGGLIVDADATLALGTNSTTGSFAHAGTLALGTNSLSVSQDYSNANSGIGNAFNRHAGVTGTGQILALGSVQQTLSGDLIQFGSTANAVLTLASMRVGDAPVSTSFTINNIGNGPSLRGAIQNGGITSATLSGSGVTAQNWGAVAAGSSSGAYTISYGPTAASSGLSGQSLAIVNNFDNVAGQTLTITGGKVYAPAVAQLDSNALNFGIVHVGDTVGSGIAVRNGAAAVALNDVLIGSASGGGGAFTVGGSFAGLGAGAQDGSSLRVGLDTSHAGIYGGTADLAFASHNADMSDLALAGQQVGLSAQVNNYAELGLSKLSGAGSFAASGNNSYTLNFGTLTLGDGSLSAELMAGNVAFGLADALGLKFELGAASLHFALNGFGPISGLGAGESQGGLQISFSGLLAGTFDDVITLHATGSNASGYAGALSDVQLHLVGEVAAVPELSSWAQMTLGLVGLVGFTARRRAARRGSGRALH